MAVKKVVKKTVKKHFTPVEGETVGEPSVRKILQQAAKLLPRCVAIIDGKKACTSVAESKSIFCLHHQKAQKESTEIYSSYLPEKSRKMFTALLDLKPDLSGEIALMRLHILGLVKQLPSADKPDVYGVVVERKYSDKFGNMTTEKEVNKSALIRKEIRETISKIKELSLATGEGEESTDAPKLEIAGEALLDIINLRVNEKSK